MSKLIERTIALQAMSGIATLAIGALLIQTMRMPSIEILKEKDRS